MNEANTAETNILPSYTLTLEKGEDGYYIIKSIDFEGVISQGKTIKEAIANGVEALSMLLEEHGIAGANITIIEK